MTSSGLENARSQTIRLQLLRLLDSDRPNEVSEHILLTGLKAYQTTPDDLHRALLYLKQRELISLRKMDGSFLATLLASGVDLLEGNVSAPPGFVLNQGLSQVELERRREIRWRLLKVTSTSGIIPLSETLAQRTLHDIQYALSVEDVRRVAIYMEQKGLIQIDRSSLEWAFQVTGDGMDVAEYNLGCPAGVGRPEKYW